MPALLQASRVTKVFGGGVFDQGATTAVRDISLTIDNEPARITAVVGETGSGKTTLGRLLLGLISPTEGEVRYKGTDLRRLSGGQRRAFLQDVQVIFQDPYEVYNPFYTVDHVLETPIARFGLARSRKEARELIESTLATVGLRPEETLGRHPHELSGGQRQRVMIGRALLVRPKLMIADEPVSMLDASLRATILQTLRQLNRELGISIVYITHDLTTAYKISHNMIVLYRGGVAEVGDVGRVVQQPGHPYTQLLVRSVPLPNPDRPWGAEPEAADGRRSVTARSCAFVDRCPFAEPICEERPPPLFRTEPDQASACYLHREAPVLNPEDMDQVLAAGRRRPVRVASQSDVTH